MRYLLLFAIRIYQKFWFNDKKGNGCLFSESCSNYVFRIVKNDGFVKGLKALLKRHKECRPGYFLFKELDDVFIITKNNTVYQNKEINPNITINIENEITN